MSTPTIAVDVNQAFADSRTAEVGRITDLMSNEGQARYIAEQTARFDARVAAGELVRLSEGKYQSTQGFDRGEVWEVTSVNGQSLVLPQHGLDLDENGKAKLYSAVPAWHGLGTVIDGGTSDVAQVIAAGGLDTVKVACIPVPDYNLPGVLDEFGNLRSLAAKGKFILANGTTGEFWNIVGNVHKNIPLETSFDFMQNLVEDHGVTFESAGLMGGGRKVFISCQVPTHVTVDAGGAADPIRMFLVVQDARDGSTSYKAMVTPWRPICQNTNRFALRDAVSSVALRHTTGLAGRIEKTRLTLGMSVRYIDAFAAEETALARTDLTIAQFEREMAELFAGEKIDVFGNRDRAAESKRSAGSADRRDDDLIDRFKVESARVGGTLYAAEQAVTGYLDWGKVRKGDGPAARWQARIEASLAGDDDQFKSRAHAQLLTLTNR
jgi:phage/plasmid-like protein (TIGR03299 family)